MTLFYNDIRPGRPQTHMLVIGVGAYPHLKDGIPDQLNYDWAGRLGQLSSPPRSARAFAEWAVDKQKGFNNPAAPLGSVDLLLSEHLQAQQGERLATMDEIEKALWNWVNRCNAHEESIAIFYFCGHGLMIGEAQLLLARDFADPNYDEFRNALHFNQMHIGLGDKCLTPYKYLFIDACSNISASNKSPNAARAVFSGGGPHRLGYAIIASSPGEMAFSEEGQISMFTDVLLTCLRGMGCERTDPPDNLWAITGWSLYQMLCKIYEYRYKKNDPFAPFYEMGRSNKRPMHVYKEPPPPGVPVIISFDPEALGRACLTLRHITNMYRFARTAPQSSEWELPEVPAGEYYLSVKFPAGHYQDIEGVDITILPPGPWPIQQPLPLRLLPLST